MRAVTKKKSIALFAIGLVSLAIAAPSSATAAGATQADVDYSTQVSPLAKEFAKVTVAWDAAISKPPILAFGSKWSKYKTAATKSSKTFLSLIRAISGFTSHPRCLLFFTATTGDLLRMPS